MELTGVGKFFFASVRTLDGPIKSLFSVVINPVIKACIAANNKLSFYPKNAKKSQRIPYDWSKIPIVAAVEKTQTVKKNLNISHSDALLRIV
jgi:hypothetical protein